MSEFTFGIICMGIELILMITAIILSIKKNDPKKKSKVDIMLVVSIVALIATYLLTDAPTPEIYPSNGQVSDDGSVKVSAQKGLSIYYTLDANIDPKEDGIKYEMPLQLEKSATINVKTHFLSKWSECVTLDLVMDETGRINGIETAEPGKSVESISAVWNKEKIFPGTILTTEDISVVGRTIDGETVQVKDFAISPNIAEEGKHIYTIVHKNIETTLEGSTVEPQLTQLQAKYIGDEVWEGDKYEKKQFKVTGIYEDGTKASINTFQISPKKAKKAGRSTVIIAKNGVETTVSMKVKESESPFIAVSELHTPNGAYDPQVTVTPWEKGEDYTIDGRTFSNGLKLKFEYLLSSLWGNDSNTMDKTESKLYISVNKKALKRKPKKERFFDGYIVVGSESNNSVTTAEVSIYADDKLIYKSGEITSASTNIPAFHIPADGVSQIIVQTNANVCGRPFYLGVVTK